MKNKPETRTKEENNGRIKHNIETQTHKISEETPSLLQCDFCVRRALVVSLCVVFLGVPDPF